MVADSEKKTRLIAMNISRKTSQKQVDYDYV